LFIVKFWRRVLQPPSNPHLAGMHASDSPQVTIPPSIMATLYCPDIVLYNERSNSAALLELTCPLDSIDHHNSARGGKKYQELQTEFDYLGYTS